MEEQFIGRNLFVEQQAMPMKRQQPNLTQYLLEEARRRAG